ncbi:MAG: hypothetical protein HOB32_08375 [Nitrospina sp.]|nr:hypothetical protein [Nitrospina sp.]MBT6601652.1 hypothetical protein [Nitrospina sp.]
MGEKGSKDFHFNVNVRTNTGSIARMANNEESFCRAMEIQERKREKIEEEQKRLEAEKKAEEKAAPEITSEPVANDEGGPTAETAGSEDSSGTPVTQDEATGSPEITAETPVTAKPAKAKPASPKPSGGGVPGPTSRAGEFTPEELDAMRERAKAHAAKVKASKL